MTLISVPPSTLQLGAGPLVDVTPLQIPSSRTRGIGEYVRGLLSGFDQLAVEYRLWGFAGEPVDGRTRQPDVGRRRFGQDHHLLWAQMVLWQGSGVGDDEMIHFTSSSVTGIERRLRVPYVVTVYDLIPLRFPDWYQPGRRHQFFYRRYLHHIRGAAHVIAISRTVRDELVERLGRRPADVTVTPLACPELPAPSGWRWRDGRPYFLVAGTPDPHKNVDLVVEAMGSLPAPLRRPLVLTGQCPDEPWKRLAHLAAARDVELIHLGHVSRQRLSDLYRGALGTLFPSRYEGFGLPALEALSVGTPLIVSEGGALPEVAGEVCPVLPFEVEAWREEIRGLVESNGSHDPDPGRRWAARFTWRRTASLTLGAYERLG